MRIITILILCLIIGCSKTKTERTTLSDVKETRVSTDYDEISLYSIEHDEHEYIIVSRHRGVGLLHSPKCKCHIKSEKENND